MKPQTEVHLFGSLRKSMEDIHDIPVRLDMDASTSINNILKNLKIDPNRVQLAMVNYKAVSKASSIHPGDRLSLFPREYPIFADWKDLRFSTEKSVLRRDNPPAFHSGDNSKA